jgi:hypothetical protein
MLHCASYDVDKRRATLHAGLGDTRGGPTHAKALLRLPLAWMKEPRFHVGLGERGKQMVERLIQVGAEDG